MQNPAYRKSALLLTALLVVAGMLFAARTVTNAAAGPVVDYTLSGRVTDATSGAGIQAHFRILSGPTFLEWDTDPTGNYSQVLPAGVYSLDISSGHCLAETFRSANLTSGNQTLNITLARRLDTTINGTAVFGYSCDDSQAFSWIPGGGTAQHVGPSEKVSITLPFAFRFFTNTFPSNVVYATSAGYFTPCGTCLVYDSHNRIPSTLPANEAGYVYWAFFDTSNPSNGLIYTATTGAAPNRRFTIEWRNMPLALDSSSVLNFEVVFYEGAGGQPGTEMDFQYLQTGNPTSGQGLESTIGIENSNGTGAFSYLYNGATPPLTNNSRVHFYLPPIGTLSGQVKDLYSSQPLRAQVCGSYPELCVSSNLNTGSYVLQLAAGTYQVQVSSSRHVTETRSVQITAGQTSTENFQLNSAHVAYIPTPIDIFVPQGQVVTMPLTISNTGTGTLQYRLREALGPQPVGCGTFDPQAAPPAGVYTVDKQAVVTDPPRAGSPARTHQAIAYHYTAAPNAATQLAQPARILVYSDQPDRSPITDTYTVEALVQLGWTYTGFFDDPVGFRNALVNNGPWDMVIAINDVSNSLADYFEDMRAYMQTPAGRMVFQTFNYQLSSAPPTTLFTQLGIQQPISVTDDIESVTDFYQWEPSEFIFRCPIVVSTTLHMVSPPNPFADYGDRLRATSQGLEWAGLTPDIVDEQAVIIGRDDGRSVAFGITTGVLGDDSNANSVDDGIDLLVNTIKYVGQPPIEWGNIPWLSESPTDGLVNGSSQFNVTLTGSSLSYTSGYTETRYLFGLSSDPNNVRVQIPVTLHITGPPQSDLAVTDVSLHGYSTSRPVINVPNQVAVTVKNVGTSQMSIPANYLYVDLYVDPASPPTSSTSTPYFGVVPAQTLQPGQTTVVEITWVPPGPAGNHQLWAWVNRECLPQVGEPNCSGSNTGNNNLAGPISGCTFASDGYTFADNQPAATFYTYIERLYCLQAIIGYDCGGPNEPCGTGNRPYFRVGNSATRGQFTKILSSALAWSDPVSGQTFQDVPASQTFYTWIQRAAARGLIGGYVCGTVPSEPCVGPANRPYFRWGNNITRAQISKVVVLARGWVTGTPTPVPTTAPYTFQDVLPTNAFFAYIEQAYAHNVITGYACGTNPNEPCVGPTNRRYFRYGANATRGQLSKMIVISTSQP